MKKMKKGLLIAGMGVCLLFSVPDPEAARASGERVYFGSEAYEWELNMDAPYLLGVYASADHELESVEFYVTYDPEMLEFVSGGEEVEPGRILVQSAETEGTEFRRMMNFIPMMGGSTQIHIEDASLNSGEGDIATGGADAPIGITVPEGCALSGIRVNGIPIENFESDITNYTLNLEEYTEQADITLFPEDINAEVSSTELTRGQNEIRIVTANEDGDRACYTLSVNCPDEETGSDPVPETTEDQIGNEKPKNGHNADTVRNFISSCLEYGKDMLLNHRVWSAAAGCLIILFIVLLILKKHLERKRKRIRKAKERSRRERQEAPSVGIKEEEQENQTKRQTDIRFNIDAGFLGKRPELRAADQLTDPDLVKPEETAKQEIIYEAASVTEEDLAQVSDYLEEDEIEIEVNHVTMDFKRESDESGSIKELVIRTLTGKRSVVKFRALDDISFTVMKGEVVGIIGTNGSGKSTILKIISGVLAPTAGTVKTDRRKIQLLTLGTGFDSELTGRENVYLNGALIGYTKEYIDEKYDDIVKFAELDGFMDERVKNYSSGMISRLGFAIATARDTPEILILDEVLSVGDMFFRKKSEARIQEMIHGGSTVLIVSHSPSVIRKNCTKVVWIEKGRLKAVGDPKEVCAAYEKMNQ